jgi:hypothetical protein
MQLRPDEIPDLVEGEVRKVTLNLSGAVGVNTISSFTVTADNLTIASASSSGVTGTFFVTGSQQGTHYIKATAVLSSGETIIGYIRATVKGEPSTSSSDDYDD